MKAAFAISVITAMSLPTPAEAASRRKTSRVHPTTTQRVVVPAQDTMYQGGVMKRPLYNGPDYLGDDPDPNIRAGLLKDRTRYQGSY